MHHGGDYWKNYMEDYFWPGLVEFHQATCVAERIASQGSIMRMETYVVDAKRPTLVFSHGIAGYARLLLPFIEPLYRRGLNLVCPDLMGYGPGRKGDFTWNDHAANLSDAAEWALRRFQGPVFLGGASMGGPLAYEAAAGREGLAGLVCWCLWDMSDPEFISRETRMGMPARPLLPILRCIAAIAGRARIKTTSIVSYDTLTGDPAFNALVTRDPQAGTLVSLRGALSLMAQSEPRLPYEAFLAPVMVFQPAEDRMTPERYSKKAFDRIRSPVKEYVRVEGAEHFPTDRAHYELWGDKAADFMARIGSS